MSKLINLTLNNTQFVIPSELLEKSDFFRGLLDIDGDNLIINNEELSVDVFRILIMMVQNDRDIIKDLAKMYDVLGFDDNYKILKSYYCLQKGCNRIKLGGSYCEVHQYNHNRCMRIGCEEDVECSFTYCIRHKCIVKDCHNDRQFNNINCDYCVVHNICLKGTCARPRKLHHWNVNKVGLCKVHSCRVLGCHEEIYYEGYCQKHYRGEKESY